MLRILPRFIPWQVVTITLLQLTEAVFVISKLNLFPLPTIDLACLKLINAAMNVTQVRKLNHTAICSYATLELNVLP
jgi:hypothetical protein